ncbi:enoyl-CoA hydratase-related protein [Umezawaea sp. NPDC059074]|uniref:enoyl-CoA hydratase-related protein n=1 Tax=Umezawaea sp. NPDC059074 TaxID=3346716 RepID=UPI0036860182
MRILLLCSAFNGLCQRVWLELRAAGHDVSVEFAISEELMRTAVELVSPDLILCPFLRERIPADIWSRHRAVILHPGPVGDRGPSSLDWAIAEAEPVWGVTALQAVEDMDAGPVWGTRAFEIPADPPRKSTLYNGPVADAAVELALEVVRNAADPTFSPTPLEHRTDAWGTLRPTMRQADREFSWTASTEEILRRVRAADGAPGVRTTLDGVTVSVFDARPGTASTGEPGTIVERRRDELLVRTGDGALWIGHARVKGSVKLPAAVALAHHVVNVPSSPEPGWSETSPDDDIHYRRVGDVGVVSFDFYNGAMSTTQCERLAAALRHASDQDTKVLLLRGGEAFSNGLNLNVIDTAEDPAGEAWRNINAIDDVCRTIITCTHQLVVASVAGNAGAGGVMLALGADRVVVRAGVVLNPHYLTMGLTGSEYWTYVLPRRVGELQAWSITESCLPMSAADAVRTGLADEVIGGEPAEFEAAVLRYAERLAADSGREELLTGKQTRRAEDERHRPLETYRTMELAEMCRDIFDDRRGFAAKRHAFVTKQKPIATPPHLAPQRGVRFATPSAVAVDTGRLVV